MPYLNLFFFSHCPLEFLKGSRIHIFHLSLSLVFFKQYFLSNNIWTNSFLIHLYIILGANGPVFLLIPHLNIFVGIFHFHWQGACWTQFYINSCYIFHGHDIGHRHNMTEILLGIVFNLISLIQTNKSWRVQVPHVCIVCGVQDSYSTGQDVFNF